ncbi:FCD domain-containing protein [Georgenia sp. SUBG003]|uniref:FCD domain-containing protein n=1 Tax=Georgenia sp. SUBG003 TaxID=1497974 RepID=UPI0004D830BE|nr:hypothetical protein DA06_21465 [Georgenia sp. SUBG003]
MRSSPRWSRRSGSASPARRCARPSAAWLPTGSPSSGRDARSWSRTCGPGDVEHLFELREALETQAARLAARRRDPATFAALRERFAAAPGLLSTTDPDRRAY